MIPPMDSKADDALKSILGPDLRTATVRLALYLVVLSVIVGIASYLELA